MHRPSLCEALKSVRTALDLSPLFTELGYIPESEPYDHGAWVVARWQGFKVIAAQVPAPRDWVRGFASRIAASDRRALVLGIGPERELVMAAPKLAGPGSTRLAVISLTKPSALMLQQLEDLRPRRSDSALAHALRVTELLTSEAAGERFFASFRLMLQRMADSLDHEHALADRRMVALISLTRVLFLYFVQAKGWLEDRQDYLRNLLDASLAARQHFHRSALNPLFFGTLNRQLADRSRRLAGARIPYLNGGLFQPHALERRMGAVVFSNSLWREVFDGLFERFRFCVREAEEVDAIAPDMLGRVFQRVMDQDERQVTGTFYTPEIVVRRLVNATVEAALGGRPGLTTEMARRVVAQDTLTPAERRLARSGVRELRLLDPAVGSGAFLLGALNTLTEINLSLLEDRDDHTPWSVRRRVLRENLFGVDISAMAVRLAELRLWLAVVADDPTSDISRVAPLPNLDGVVRQGDSLMDPIGAARALGVAISSGSSQVVAEARRHLFDSRGTAHGPALNRLRQAEAGWAAQLAAQARKRLDGMLRDLVGVARGRDLFGRRAGLTAAQRRHYRLLRRQRLTLRRAEAEIANGSIPFFAFEVHAPDVWEAGGFDAVVGNPPWVRSERLPPGHRSALAQRFSWWRGTPGRAFGHLPDLSVAFLQRALEVVRPGGAVGFLLPSKVASAGYGEAARLHAAQETTIRLLHRVPPAEAQAFGATTYPLAVVLQKQRPPKTHRVPLGLDSGLAVSQSFLQAPGPWIMVADRARAALADLKSSGRPLAELALPALGVKTGANGVFVGQVRSRTASTARVAFGEVEVELEASLLRPALRGRDVRRFAAAPSGVLLYAYHASRRPLPRLPPLCAAYLARCRTRLERRTDHQDQVPWALFRLRGALASHRVVWPDIARRPVAVALDETSASRALPLNTCYVAPAPDQDSALVIAAVMNSTWAAALAGATADEARGGYLRINARVASEMPIPPQSSARSRLVELSRWAHKNGRIEPDQMDEAVADALALSARTRSSLRTLAATKS